MRKALTDRQQAVYNYIINSIPARNDRRVWVLAEHKNEWESRKFYNAPGEIERVKGPALAHLEMLEKKGYIKLHTDYERHTGMFNPKADSWGYSAWSRQYFAEVL